MQINILCFADHQIIPSGPRTSKVWNHSSDGSPINKFVALKWKGRGRGKREDGARSVKVSQILHDVIFGGPMFGNENCCSIVTNILFL